MGGDTRGVDARALRPGRSGEPLRAGRRAVQAGECRGRRRVLAEAVVDARSAHDAGPVKGLYANMAVSSLAAIGVAIATASGVADVLRVWGAWAIVSGLVQLLVGVARRPMGGQWAMIAGGGISVPAGASFVASASKDDPSLTNLAGYAALGGIFFLVSAIRLPRTTPKD